MTGGCACCGPDGAGGKTPARRDLYLRLSDELADLVRVCDRIEAALCRMPQIGRPVDDEAVISLQGLDRMRQTLQDIDRLAQILAVAAPGAMPIAEIHRQLVLDSLADRLTRGTGPQARPASDAAAPGEIGWF